MPKVLHCPTRIDMAAEDYHALRMDQNFDAFCAVRTKSKFSLQARSSEELKGHTIEHMECLLAYEENPIPAALRNALGAPLSSPAPTQDHCHTHRVRFPARQAPKTLPSGTSPDGAVLWSECGLLAPLPWFPGPRLAAPSPRAAAAMVGRPQAAASSSPDDA